MIIAVDFDGTCVTHEYPFIGRSVGAEEVLHELIAAGHQLILWTMRSGEHLDAAVTWFEERSIVLFGVNSNPTQKDWSASPKAYAHMYIDDAALGIPLKYDEADKRAFVNWVAVKNMLTEQHILGRTRR